MRGQDASIGDALRQTLHDIRELIRAEIVLARTELRAEVTRARAAVLLLAVAGALGFTGFVFALAAAAWGIVEITDWPIWTGFAIVAAVMLPLAGALTIAGVARLSRKRPMGETVETMKENVEWLQARTH
jgi:hypothetical protein